MTDAQLLVSPVPGVELRFAHVNGVRLRYASAGPTDGPLVLLVHGWPELWFSWRHQLLALGAAGFRAVAPDCRGYGGSDAPERREAYDCATICADMVALLRHELLRERAILVGHDWGAILGWQLCLLEPRRFVAYVGMSVPPMFHTRVSPMKESTSSEEHPVRAHHMPLIPGRSTRACSFIPMPFLTTRMEPSRCAPEQVTTCSCPCFSTSTTTKSTIGPRLGHLSSSER